MKVPDLCKKLLILRTKFLSISKKQTKFLIRHFIFCKIYHLFYLPKQNIAKAKLRYFGIGGNFPLNLFKLCRRLSFSCPNSLLLIKFMTVMLGGGCFCSLADKTRIVLKEIKKQEQQER